MDCTRCGACCVAPDISSLGKPLRQPCKHLSAENLCTIYEKRPEVCSSYQPDALCEQIAASTLAERVEKYLTVFGLENAS